ncbi:hypothetical protein BDW68DRAFT_179551 [Aspergillus falconensis]
MQVESLTTRGSRISETLAVLDSAGKDESLSTLRGTLLNDCYEVQLRCHRPSAYIEQVELLSCLKWLYKFGISSHIPTNGTVAYTELAIAARAPVNQLRRIVRMVVTSGSLSEPEPDRVSPQRSLCCVLRKRRGVPILLPPHLDVLFPPDHTADAHNIANNTPLPYEFLSQSEEEMVHFARYMQTLDELSGLSKEHLLQFDRGSLGDARLVGGNKGQARAFLASRFPSLACMLQDLLAAVEEAQSTFASPGPSISTRLHAMPHDLTKPTATRDRRHDRHLHAPGTLDNWPADKVQLILGHLASAMKPGAAILVVDLLMPKPGEVPPRQEAYFRCPDLLMAQFSNSGERDLEEWTEVIHGVTPKLRIADVIRPETTPVGMLMLKTEDE